jgi:hypothetical protein
VGSCASPVPLERIADEICLDRVPCQVAAGTDQVLVAFDFARQRMRPEKVSAAVVAVVQVARVGGVEPLQRARDALVRDAQGEVVVVAHQDVGEEPEPEALADDRDPVEEVLAVLIAEEEVTGVARLRGEMEEPCSERPESACHLPTVGSAGLAFRSGARSGAESAQGCHTAPLTRHSVGHRGPLGEQYNKLAQGPLLLSRFAAGG